MGQAVEHIFKEAPSPTRGVSKAIYLVVQEIGGNATSEQIRKLLPGATDASLTRKHLKKHLDKMIWNGYLAHSQNRYSIAPYTFYQARQNYVRSLPSAATRKSPPKQRKQSTTKPNVIYTTQPNWWAVAACSFAAALAGVILGGVINA